MACTAGHRGVRPGHMAVRCADTTGGSVSQSAKPATGATEVLRKELQGVRFSIQARIAEGKMTVGELLDLKPGSIVRSEGTPGGRIQLCSGSVRLATAEPLVEDGRLLVRIADVGTGRE